MVRWVRVVLQNSNSGKTSKSGNAGKRGKTGKTTQFLLQMLMDDREICYSVFINVH